MTDKNQRKVKLLSKIIGTILLLCGAYLVTLGIVDLISSLTKSIEPSLFLCTFLGIPTFSIGLVLLMYGFISKFNLTITKEAVNTDESLHKVTVTNSYSGEVDTNIKKICPNCKKQSDNDSSFCRFCGTKL